MRNIGKILGIFLELMCANCLVCHIVVALINSVQWCNYFVSGAEWRQLCLSKKYVIVSASCVVTSEMSQFRAITNNFFGGDNFFREVVYEKKTLYPITKFTPT